MIHQAREEALAAEEARRKAAEEAAAAGVCFFSFLFGGIAKIGGKKGGGGIDGANGDGDTVCVYEWLLPTFPDLEKVTFDVHLLSNLLSSALDMLGLNPGDDDDDDVAGAADEEAVRQAEHDVVESVRQRKAASLAEVRPAPLWFHCVRVAGYQPHARRIVSPQPNHNQPHARQIVSPQPNHTRITRLVCLSPSPTTELNHKPNHIPRWRV